MISVVMCSYNGEKYISKQLESILSQMPGEDELVISYDGSEDQTISIIHSFMQKYHHIKLFQGPRQGFVRNFIFAIGQATGDIIFLSDQDDIWMDRKIETVKNGLEQNNKYKVALHNMYLFNDNDDIIKEKFINFHHGVMRNVMFSCYWGCCMAFKKEFLNNNFFFPNGIISHDQWIGIISEINKSSIFIDDILIGHRIHGDNMSKEGSFISKVEFRLNIVKGVLEYLWKTK